MSSEHDDSISNTDEAKGRAKEAAGAITGDDELKDEGRDDQRVGEAKSKVDQVADKLKEGIDDVRSRLRGDDS
jgi:uncharacterized protein YjbJ (UPF0337 family)